MQTINNNYTQLLKMIKRLFVWMAVLMTAFVLTSCPANNDASSDNKQTTNEKETDEKETDEKEWEEPSVIDKVLYTHYNIGGTEIGETIVSIISGDDTTQDKTGQIYMYNNDNFDVTNCTGKVTAYWLDADVLIEKIMASGLNTSSPVDATPDLIRSLLSEVLQIQGQVEYIFDEDSYTATYNGVSESNKYDIFLRGEYVKYYKKDQNQRLKSISVSYDADYSVTEYEEWEYNEKDLESKHIQYLIDSNNVLRWNASSKQVEVVTGKLTESYHAEYYYNDNDWMEEEFIMELHPHFEREVIKWEIKSGEAVEVHDDTPVNEEYHKTFTRNMYYWNNYLPLGIPAIIETYCDNSSDEGDEYITTRTFNTCTAEYDDTYTITCNIHDADGEIMMKKVQTYQRNPFNLTQFYLYMEEVSQFYSGTMTDYYTMVDDRYDLENIPYYVTSMNVNSKLYR